MRAWSARLASVVLATGGLCTGLALGGSLGVTGCSCFCGEPDPVELGTFEIREGADRGELGGGSVEVATEQIEIRFTDVDGADWLIVYRVAAKYD
jgi:hypothetical protein